jgi:hypothetical protein
LVNYKGYSEREIVTRIEVEEGDPELRCEASWISLSEVYADGTPFNFRLQRRNLRTIREDGCGDSPHHFVSRAKTYRFAFDTDSQPIMEQTDIAPSSGTPSNLKLGATSNANVWTSISTDESSESTRTRPSPDRDASAPQFCRTAWVMARKDIRAHYVGIVRGVDQRETIVPLGKTRAIRARELGQIEASNGHTAIVRFYSGGRIGKLSRRPNALRRWYDSIGGPYTPVEDDLYTPLSAHILEVSLDDIVEINDYLDQQKADQR